MGGVEFAESDIQRIQRAFGLDRESAIQRLEQAAQRTQDVAARSATTTEDGTGS